MTSFGNPCNLEAETCPNLVFYNKLKKILAPSPISGKSLYWRLFHTLVLAGFGLFVSYQTLVKHFFDKCIFNTFISKYFLVERTMSIWITQFANGAILFSVSLTYFPYFSIFLFPFLQLDNIYDFFKISRVLEKFFSLTAILS